MLFLPALAHFVLSRCCVHTEAMHCSTGVAATVLPLPGTAAKAAEEIDYGGQREAKKLQIKVKHRAETRFKTREHSKIGGKNQTRSVRDRDWRGTDELLAQQ